MERKAFGKLADGEEATLYTISNTKEIGRAHV